MEMKQQFISHTLAKQLKEKGFNEPCLSFFNRKGQLVRYHNGDKDWNDLSGQSMKNSDIKLLDTFTAPTTQQVTDWLREVHHLHLYVDTTPAFDTIHPSMWKVSIKKPFQPFKWTTGYYYTGKTYYEAIYIGIEEALKLIP